MTFYYNKERLKIIKRLGSVCFICGSSENLEIHHIVPIKNKRPNGRFDKLFEWKRNPENLMLLCRACHRHLHREIYDLIDF